MAAWRISFSLFRRASSAAISLRVAICTSLALALAPCPNWAAANIYVASRNDNTLSAYAIDPDGLLVSIGTYASGSVPVGVAASGGYLYVTDVGTNTVSAFAIGAGGGLSPVGTYATGNTPQSIAASGSYLYVANLGNNSVSVFTIGSKGALTPVGSYGTGEEPACVLANGGYLYVTNSKSNTISVYAIGLDGALAPIGSYAAGENAHWHRRQRRPPVRHKLERRKRVGVQDRFKRLSRSHRLFCQFRLAARWNNRQWRLSIHF